MNPHDLFLKSLAILAEHCQFKLESFTIDLYFESLQDLGFENVALAIREILKTRKATDRFPSIADIRNIIQPEISSREAATDLANQLIAAISRLGRYARISDVEYEVGEAGMEVITRMGGWPRFVEMTDDCDISIFKAQLRDLIEAVQKKARAGTLHEKAKLNQPIRNNLDFISKALPKMPN